MSINHLWIAIGYWIKSERFTLYFWRFETCFDTFENQVHTAAYGMLCYALHRSNAWYQLILWYIHMRLAHECRQRLTALLRLIALFLLSSLVIHTRIDFRSLDGKLRAQQKSKVRIRPQLMMLVGINKVLPDNSAMLAVLLATMQAFVSIHVTFTCQAQ